MYRHDCWTSTGERSILTKNPLKRRWSGGCGERNILHSGNGEFAPYLVSDNRIETFGSGYDYNHDKQILLCGAREAETRIFVQRWSDTASDWVTEPHGPASTDLEAKHDELVGIIKFPDAPYRLELQHRHGRSDRINVRTLFNASTSARIRFQLVVAGVVNPRRIPFGFVTDEFRFEWKRFEDGYHDVDFAGESATVTIGPFDYVRGKTLDISPIQYGPTQIAGQADDGSEYVSNTWDDTPSWFAIDFIFMADDNAGGDEPRWAAWTWTPDLDTGAGIASIDAPTQIATINPGNNGNPQNVTAALGAVDANDPAAIGALNLPSAQVLTTASLAVTGSLANQNFNVQPMVNELAITNARTFEGLQRMQFIMAANSAGSDWWSVSDQFGGPGTPATIEINYTASAGPGGAQPPQSRISSRLMRTLLSR